MVNESSTWRSPEAGSEMLSRVGRSCLVIIHKSKSKRLRDAGGLAVQGILAAQSPLITEMARSGKEREAETTWPIARRLERCLWNPGFTQRHLLKGRYAIAPTTVTQHPRAYLVVALAPVNGEKPYTRALEGVPTRMTSTPARTGHPRVAPPGRETGAGLGLRRPVVLLAGISAVFVTVSAIAFAARYPFLRGAQTYGESPVTCQAEGPGL